MKDERPEWARALAQPPVGEALESPALLSEPAWTKAYTELEPAWMKAVENAEARLIENIADASPDWSRLVSNAEPAWLKVMEDRAVLSVSEPDWSEAFAGLEPAWMKSLEASEAKWIENIARAEPAWSKFISTAEIDWVASIVEQFEHQQALLKGLIQGKSGEVDFGIVAAGSVAGTFPEQIAELRHELVVGLDPEADSAEAEEWGRDALNRIAAEREAILTGLKRAAMLVGGAKAAGVEVPAVIIVLLIAFVLLGEVADEVLREREDRQGP